MLTFQKWMQEIDEICLEEYLMSIYDLPDMNFMDAYEDGMSPEAFMAEMIPDLESLGQLILS